MNRCGYALKIKLKFYENSTPIHKNKNKTKLKVKSSSDGLQGAGLFWSHDRLKNCTV